MNPRSIALVAFVVGALATLPARAQCPTEPRLENFTGAGSVVCPCFVPGEEAGAILDLPASEFPIEILKVGIGWGSQFGGNPDQLEEAINIYEGGLPNPGAPIFTLPGPVLVDGAINEFDLEPLPGSIIVNSGPFMVTLKFFNQSTAFGPSVVHDGNGCQPGKNSVFAIPGGWADACPLGVTGDWVFYVFYRKVNCAAAPGSVPDGKILAGTPLLLGRASTNFTLTWSPSCSAGDTDYEIYEGFLVAPFFYSHFSKLCSTAGATSTSFPLGAGPDRYYLVVPTDGTDEGSYGLDSGGTPRPRGGGACKAAQNVSCP